MSSAAPGRLHAHQRAGQRRLEWALGAMCFVAAIVPLVVLVMLLGKLIVTGVGRLDWDFLTSYGSRHAMKAGVLAGLAGSTWLVALTAAIGVPIGVGAAIWLEELGGRGRSKWVSSLVEANIQNLAGVPSILYGLLGLEVFVRLMGLGRTLIAGALTLALLVLPVVVVTTREGLRTVPRSLREAGLALGATRWQVVRRCVLPLALPHILPGSILAVARALGETAPLVVMGVAVLVNFVPEGLDSEFTALPLQIYNWASRPEPEFLVNSAAAVVVLLGVLLVLNAGAIVLRQRARRNLPQ